MLKPIASQSTPIEGVLFFDLFGIRHKEPFLVMYGFSAAWGYELTEKQMKLVKRSLHSRAIYEKWFEIGKECKAGTRPLPEWVKSAKAVTK
jgi:hypothetical protein